MYNLLARQSKDHDKRWCSLWYPKAAHTYKTLTLNVKRLILFLYFLSQWYLWFMHILTALVSLWRSYCIGYKNPNGVGCRTKQSTSLYRTIHHESCTFVEEYTVTFSLAIDALYPSTSLYITVNIVSLQKYQLLVQLSYYYGFFFFYFILSIFFNGASPTQPMGIKQQNWKECVFLWVALNF